MEDGLNQKSERNNSLSRQFQAEGSPLSFGALDTDCAAHQIDVAFHDGQAESGVQAIGLARRIGAVKAFENMFACFRRDADAGVPNLHEDMAVLLLQSQLDASFGAIVLDRIVEEVGQCVAELVGGGREHERAVLLSCW